jgi:hypothetical protein
MTRPPRSGSGSAAREPSPDGANALVELSVATKLDDYAIAIRSGGRVTTTLELLDDRRWPDRNITADTCTFSGMERS